MRIKTEQVQVWVILPRMSLGGIPACRLRMITLMREWGVPVTLVVVKAEGDLMQAVPADVRVLSPSRLSKWSFPFFLYKEFRREKPHIALCAYDDVNLLVSIIRAISGVQANLLLSNHVSFRETVSNSEGVDRFRYVILKRFLPFALRKCKAIVSVSSGVADDLSSSLGIPRELIHVIYNPVINSDFDGRARLPASHTVTKETLLFVGRLVPQKDIPNLLAACVILKQQRRLDVLIVGDGSERAMIEAQVNKMGLTGSVRLAGVVQNPLPLMSGCGLLVLPSRFEGLGNVLIEAMACGTQVVSTDCPHGPAEILDDGRYGQLVPVSDPAALAAAIERSLNGEFRVEPEVLRARAAEFSVEKATRRYLELAGYDVSTLPPAEPAAPRIRPVDG